MDAGGRATQDAEAKGRGEGASHIARLPWPAPTGQSRYVTKTTAPHRTLPPDKAGATKVARSLGGQQPESR